MNPAAVLMAEIVFYTFLLILLKEKLENCQLEPKEDTRKLFARRLLQEWAAPGGCLQRIP